MQACRGQFGRDGLVLQEFGIMDKGNHYCVHPRVGMSCAKQIQAEGQACFFAFLLCPHSGEALMSRQCGFFVPSTSSLSVDTLGFLLREQYT